MVSPFEYNEYNLLKKSNRGMTITNDTGKLETKCKLSLNFINWTSISGHFKIV